MKRIHAFELEDQPWFPRVIREAGMAYLRFAGEKLGQWERVRPAVEGALERSGEHDVLDLCSGGGGPVMALARGWHADGRKVGVTLTDRYPDDGARRLAAEAGIPGLSYDAEPVEATDLRGDRPGLRTLFNAFHHLRPNEATALLASVVRDRKPIAVVEVLKRSPIAMLGLLFAPVIVLLLVPFLRPFRLVWIPLTYLVPIIPLFVLWDGMISCLRIYTEDELLEMASQADPEGSFDWRVESIDLSPQPIAGSALIGIPREQLEQATND
jgi:hypothetical protein